MMPQPNSELVLKKQSLTVVFGLNGSGKTTFVRTSKIVLESKVQQDSNIAYFHEQHVPLRKNYLLTGKLLVTFLLRCMTFQWYQTESYDVTHDFIFEFLRDWLDWTQLPSKIYKFSDGQAKYFKLAQWLCANIHKEVLILDEPFNSLDVCRQDELVWFLKSLSQCHSKAIIIITHGSHTLLESVKTRSITMDRYRIVNDNEHANNEYYNDPNIDHIMYLPRKRQSHIFLNLCLITLTHFVNLFEIGSIIFYIGAIIHLSYVSGTKANDRIELAKLLNSSDPAFFNATKIQDSDLNEIMFTFGCMYVLRIATMTVLTLKIYKCLEWECRHKLISTIEFCSLIFLLYCCLFVFEIGSYIYVARVNNYLEEVVNIIYFFGSIMFFVGLIQFYHINLWSRGLYKCFVVFCIFIMISLSAINSLSTVWIYILSGISYATLISNYNTLNELLEFPIYSERNIIFVILTIYFVTSCPMLWMIRKYNTKILRYIHNFVSNKSC